VSAQDRVIAGRYELGPVSRILSLGGKLVTHEGRDASTGEAVLICAMKPRHVSNPIVLRAEETRFDAMAKLDHPAILPILARHVDVEHGEFMYVTRPLQGSTLSRLLRDGTLFTERQAVDLALMLLDALAHAHARGVCFGNVKTSNVFVTPARDRAILIGLPKPPFRFTTIPDLGAYLGNPAECPPELIRDGAFDPRADLYGVGLALYEMCAGRLPFKVVSSLASMFEEIVENGLPPASQLNPDLAPKLDEIIAKAVARDPAARFQSAREMADALSKLQTRPVRMVTRERLRELVTDAMPTPIAHTCASIDHHDDESAQLQRLIDAAAATVQLLGTIAIASRLTGSAPPLPEDLAASFARPSLGHWCAILREGARGAAVPEMASFMADERGKPTPAARAVDALVALRNEIRHGATIGASAARKKLAEFRPQLEALLRDALFLRNTRLFVARRLDFVDGAFACDVRVLQGAYPSLQPVTVRLPQPVTLGQVYLADDEYARVLSVHPLVVVSACPVCEDEEIFLYESASASRVHFHSFAKGHGLPSEALLPAFEKARLLPRGTLRRPM
jgi:serine/threonine protein kinase